ncbi:(d)CMP kinase [Roseicyclus persicicus]|uniref:Cytidylate kinase n=1 Tax=Roseicyclus persicicus TaxID=2650661 RepID=A0A7X6GVR6_9RHOB|nr:d(CMP) kinase [Roseibacterium persicicum]NKX43296.1 (d)CMP kinase [Roseibacterium persicicum]
MSFTVAIDGPAAAGKGTISRAVAAHFGFAHLDTGLLYRAVGRRMLAGEAPIAAAGALTPEDLSDPDALRTAAIAEAASKVAVIPEVRAALLDFQRAFARRAGGAVLDGRDIGTVICPEAEVKLFVTASPEVRAERRLKELRAAGHDTDYATVLADVLSRDARDAERATAPMLAAADALTLDTSAMTIDEAVAAAIAAVGARR